jgi:hypothetical protein
MFASREYRNQAWDWAKSRPWLQILVETALLLLFILTSTRLLLRH